MKEGMRELIGRFPSAVSPKNGEKGCQKWRQINQANPLQTCTRNKDRGVVDCLPLQELIYQVEVYNLNNVSSHGDFELKQS